jgi:hypothetical protein
MGSRSAFSKSVLCAAADGSKAGESRAISMDHRALGVGPRRGALAVEVRPFSARALDICGKGIFALADLVLSQLTDVFRIGLIVALVATMHRTAAVTGRVLPSILGVVFVAVIIPATLPSGSVSLADAVLAGLVSNTIILIPVLAGARLIARWRR